MNVLIFIFIFQLLKAFVQSKDDFTIHFVRSFIENEQKPTHLIYNLCWKRNVEIKLVNQVALSGVRSSAVMETSKYQDHELLFLLDLDCIGAQRTIEKANLEGLLRSPFRWLVLLNGSHSTTSASASQMATPGSMILVWNSPLLADSDFVMATRTPSGYILTELHRPSTQGSMHSTPRGYYNGTFTDVRPHRELFKRRKNVMGHVLTMSNVIQDSNTTQYHLPREDRLEPQYDSVAKISWSNARLAFEMLNATPAHTFSHRWGYKQNGTWSGMINDIYSNRADLGTNCLVKADRLPVVVYTDRIASFRVRFIFRQPPLSYVSNIFSLPFSTSVWVAMVLCAAVSTATLYLASRWEATLGKSPSILDGSIGDALLLTMSAVSQQGCVMEPKKAAGRIMVWVVFAALMALYAAYSANIVVLLQAPSSSIKTLAQLAHSKLTLAANDVDYNHFVFSQYKDPVRVQIFKKVDPEKGKKQFYEINKGIERIRQGLFAFHSIVEPVYRGIEETFLETEKCDLMEVDFLNEFDPFTPVKRDSPYLELLRVAFSIPIYTNVIKRKDLFKRIRESGIQAALTKRLQVPKPRCSDKGSAFSSVGLLDIKPVLLLMMYGILLSVLIAVTEIIVFKLKHRHTYVT